MYGVVVHVGTPYHVGWPFLFKAFIELQLYSRMTGLYGWVAQSFDVHACAAVVQMCLVIASREDEAC